MWIKKQIQKLGVKKKNTKIMASRPLNRYTNSMEEIEAEITKIAADLPNFTYDTSMSSLGLGYTTVTPSPGTSATTWTVGPFGPTSNPNVLQYPVTELTENIIEITAPYGKLYYVKGSSITVGTLQQALEIAELLKPRLPSKTADELEILKI